MTDRIEVIRHDAGNGSEETVAFDYAMRSLAWYYKDMVFVRDALLAGQTLRTPFAFFTLKK